MTIRKPIWLSKEEIWDLLRVINAAEHGICDTIDTEVHHALEDFYEAFND